MTVREVVVRLRIAVQMSQALLWMELQVCKIVTIASTAIRQVPNPE
jgi:hypothetical protein